VEKFLTLQITTFEAGRSSPQPTPWIFYQIIQVSAKIAFPWMILKSRTIRTRPLIWTALPLRLVEVEGRVIHPSVVQIDAIEIEFQ